jgi:hypothetical protein
LPEGDPPFKPNDLPDQENVFIKEARRLVHFVEGGNTDLKQMRRETLFIEMLEAVAPKDALLLLAIKNKKLPYKGIDESIVRDAFPDLLPSKEAIG